MKKISAIITMILMLLAMLGGCKSNVVTPTVSPNVPVVSESSAIPSPAVASSPKVSATVKPSASPAAAPTTSK